MYNQNYSYKQEKRNETKIEVKELIGLLENNENIMKVLDKLDEQKIKTTTNQIRKIFDELVKIREKYKKEDRLNEEISMKLALIIAKTRYNKERNGLDYFIEEFVREGLKKVIEDGSMEKLKRFIDIFEIIVAYTKNKR